MTRNTKIHIYIISLIIVGSVSYYVVDGIMLRAAQLANNTMTPEFNWKSVFYVSGICVAYSILYWIFIRDITKDEEHTT